MKLTIFGSTGRTGEHLVRKALERGHQVVAYARTPEKISSQHKKLSIVQGNIRESDTVAGAIKGVDGVISAIGPQPGTPEDLMEIAAVNIISGMKEHDVERLIWSTGAGVSAPEDQPTFMHKTIELLLKLLSKKALENALRGAAVVKNSDLDWTIARAPMLTDEPGRGGYQISYVGPDFGRTLSRENFAEFMLDLVESDEWVQDMPAASDHSI